MVGGVAPRARIMAAAVKDKSEMSDWELFLDRWNTRGGAVVATFLAIFIGYAFEKILEFAGVDSITAGIWTSAVFFFGLLVWTFTYMTRVMTKSTTYAEQLAKYEQDVMIRRLEELDPDEIAALCEEVGVTEKELQECMQEAGTSDKKLSQKEKVLAVFKNTPAMLNTPQDPRAFF